MIDAMPYAALAAAGLTVLLSCAPDHGVEETPPAKPRYVFLFVGDGMGLAQIEAARVVRAVRAGGSLADGMAPLSFTELPAAGVVSTEAANVLVTDSAAAGTALATGVKTNYGMIGVAADGETVITSVAEHARNRGMRVGIVTSVSLDHATPASFYAHQPSRASFHAIARELAASSFDFFGGGGFLEPIAAEGTKLPDGEPADIYALLADNGYRIDRVHWTDAGLVTETGRPALAGSSRSDRVVLIDENLDEQQAMHYSIDRPPEWANLSDFTRAAIDHLEDPAGFFLLVESGRIDWACHANDAGAALGEVLEFSDAVDVALAFMRGHPNETLVVVTADHETGGLALSAGMGDAAVFSSAMSGQRVSADFYGRRLRARLLDSPGLSLEDLAPELELAFGITLTLDPAAPLDAAGPEAPLDLDDTARLAEALEVTRSAVASGSGQAHRDPFAESVVHAIAERAGLVWSSGQHTATPVGVFAAGVGHERFEAALDNTDIGIGLRELLPSEATPTP